MAEGERLIHASCVAISEAGVLIMGPPGSGKSDLALRLIEKGAVLVSDDQTCVVRSGSQLRASPPATISGKLEIRGLGILDVAHKENIAVALVVELRPAAGIARMPQPEEMRISFCGVDLPLILLDPASASAPARLHAALRHLVSR